MVTRIHPEITEVPEYNPFDDGKVVNLGPHDRMTVKQALSVTYQENLKSVVTIGECNCCKNMIMIYSNMTNEKVLFLLERMKQEILSEGISDEYDPEDTG